MICNFKIILDSFISIFFMLNSLMNMWIVISFTPHMTYKQRKITIKKSIFVATAAIVVFAVVGQFILSGLNVTMAAMKITGALLVCPSAYEMIVGHSIDNTKSEKADLHFFPIGVPIIAGPGVFTTVLFMFKSLKSPCQLLYTVIGIGLGIYATYIMLNIGNRFGSKLNSTYIRMLSIFFGTILLALGSQFMIDGVLMVAKVISSQ